MAYENFKVEIDGDGIAVFTFDVPGRSMNTLTASVLKDLPAIADQVKNDPAIKGAVITAGKPSGFCAGADLGEMEGNAGGGSGGPASAEDKLRAQFEGVYATNMVFRQLETCGKPVAAAINGLALGGGLEVCLATHYRVVGDNPRIQLGLPECKIGLLPGGGGTQRLPRLIGVQNALPLLLQGKPMTPAEAKQLGVVHELVPAGQEVAAAKAWIKAGGSAVQPWDQKNFRQPGGAIHGGSQAMVVANALLRKETFGNFPAQRYILSCVYEGLQVPIEAGLRIEGRYFVKLLNDPRAKAMIRSLFIAPGELNKGLRRPKGAAPTDVKKVGILGAGMMGAGIAYVSAQAGIDVVLLDTSLEAAEKGKAYSTGLLDKQVAKGKLSAEKRDAFLSKIKATADYADLAGVDLVIEAVFENRDIKADVTRKTEAVVGAATIFGSNTSTLPISGLAEASQRPEQFIGIHFFSPVDRMPLVEIIMGKKTSDAALATALDYVKKIRKTPIVVNDARGFYTSRCFGTYVGEGLEMLAEGIAPAIIDNVGRATSMPRGPLELNDDVALDLSYKVRQQTKADLGDAYVASPADALIETMVNTHGRFGRKNGKGFYDYPKDGKKALWPGLSDLVAVKTPTAEPEDVEELRKRFLYRQAVEAARCFAEGVVTDAREADVGAIMGWGFAPWTGGPLSLIDMVGTQKFVEECDRLAQKYGARFTPPQQLRDMAARGEGYYTRARAQAAE
ncbi:3-hydroxyacyl-CoA dehydrogenase NAD-binding domain-containing protein [Zavarzinia sp. CC-PAN008]|uniref:3-hydroxyacyl-CoA dehydrogenase NAD-binding domain-containing protein n=1 Tax=Zavarzinia sp. CC-PAN008 TaxID=3243332 RepID=UPI003F7443A1